MSDYYSPGQLETALLPVLGSVVPKWLILGGPADANEAQTARRLWPDIKVIGVEPNREAVWWQFANGWPRDCLLFHQALCNRGGVVTEMAKSPGNLRIATLDLASAKHRPETINEHVMTVTLDWLDEQYGSFEDAVVWLDIEGSELKALQGASNLIASGRVILWNIEMQDRVPGLMEGVPKLLKGYRAVKDWNASETCRDRVFLREDLCG